mmetsp:Transcript_26872/g.75475  ORF Transcript_26872/g.75475 Transcript_26872/m.75475 type:complete len:441 (-) Transcript_26872:134-1456(-)
MIRRNINTHVLFFKEVKRYLQFRPVHFVRVQVVVEHGGHGRIVLMDGVVGRLTLRLDLEEVRQILLVDGLDEAVRGRALLQQGLGVEEDVGKARLELAEDRLVGRSICDALLGAFAVLVRCFDPGRCRLGNVRLVEDPLRVVPHHGHEGQPLEATDVRGGSRDGGPVGRWDLLERPAASCSSSIGLLQMARSAGDDRVCVGVGVSASVAAKGVPAQHRVRAADGGEHEERGVVLLLHLVQVLRGDGGELVLELADLLEEDGVVDGEAHEERGAHEHEQQVLAQLAHALVHGLAPLHLRGGAAADGGGVAAVGVEAGGGAVRARVATAEALGGAVGVDEAHGARVAVAVAVAVADAGVGQDAARHADAAGGPLAMAVVVVGALQAHEVIVVVRVLVLLVVVVVRLPLGGRCSGLLLRLPRDDRHGGEARCGRASCCLAVSC